MNLDDFRRRVQAVGRTGMDILAMHQLAAHRAGVRNALIRCPDHEDKRPSCSVDLDSGMAFCHSCGFRAGDVVALHKALGRFATMGDALRNLEGQAGVMPPRLVLRPSLSRGPSGTGRNGTGNPVIIRTWLYRSTSGDVAFEIRRIQYRRKDGTWVTNPKSGKPEKDYRPVDPATGRVGMPDGFDRPGSRPLLHLPEILAADPTAEVYVCEGEPAATALMEHGVLATTSSGGAAAPARTDWSPLVGHRVRIWPDNDAAGRRYADEVAELLKALDSIVYVDEVDISGLDLPPGGDAVDWFQNHDRMPQ